MGAYTLLQDLTVSTNSTSVVLNDFGTITKDDFVKVVTTTPNGTTGNPVISLYPNGNTTATNYYSQTLAASGSSVSAGRDNRNWLDLAQQGQTSFNTAYLKLSENNKYNHFSNNIRQTSTAIEVFFSYTTSISDFTSGITSLTLQSASANGIGTGSRIQIYKLDAVKIADITVTSNTTQVDISNLSIDKDSEYLLVSDLIPGGDMFLYVNDNTTATNFYSQRIEGNGSSASAGRTNNSRYMDGSSNRGLAYSHIKLSNIGAYTSQNYSIRESGTSGIRLQNRFVSSTAENITSITKLNVVCSLTNGIPTGSRFILYKLYE